MGVGGSRTRPAGINSDRECLCLVLAMASVSFPFTHTAMQEHTTINSLAAFAYPTAAIPPTPNPPLYMFHHHQPSSPTPLAPKPFPRLCVCRANPQNLNPYKTAVSQYLRRLALAIDTALNMSGGLAATAAAATAAVGGGGRPPDADSAAAQQQQQGRVGRNKKQHVADLLLVKARPMYGYYQDEMLFIKVVL